MEPTTKKKLIIGLSIGVAVTIIFAALSSSAKKPTIAPTAAGDGTIPNGTNPSTPSNVPNAAPHSVGCGMVSWTLDGVTVTGKQVDPPASKPTSGLAAHSDQVLYGAPYVKCVIFAQQ